MAERLSKATGLPLKVSRQYGTVKLVEMVDSGYRAFSPSSAITRRELMVWMDAFMNGYDFCMESGGILEWSPGMGAMEEEPRDVTFKGRTFSRFALRHGIGMDVVPFDPMGVIPAEAIERSANFVVTLRREGREFTTKVEFGEPRDRLPTIDDILEYVANEAAVFEAFKDDPRRYAALIRRITGSAPSPEYLERLFVKLSEMTGRLSGFLGEDVYQEFLYVSEARGPWVEFS